MLFERENLADSRAKKEIYEFFVLDFGRFFSYSKNLIQKRRLELILVKIA
tara:strand:+ start:68 stop:217 length:150 start_codon:yes stop_codon:yes gene_type:complete